MTDAARRDRSSCCALPPIAPASSPTYFEALTLIAFIAFADAQVRGRGARSRDGRAARCDECGPSARRADHADRLRSHGVPRHDAFARSPAEKAGVIHRGAIVLTSNDDPRVLDVLRKRAAKFGNPFHRRDGRARHAARRRVPASATRRWRCARPRSCAAAAADHARVDRARRRDDALARTAGANRARRESRSGSTAATTRTPSRAIVPFIARACSASPPARLRDHERQGRRRGDGGALSAVRRDHRHGAVSAAIGVGVAVGCAGGSIVRSPSRIRARAIERALASDYSSIVIAGSLYLAGAAIEFFSRGGAETRRA